MLEKADETESRIMAARGLMVDIEGLMAKYSGPALEKAMLAIKPAIDAANTSTVCDKTELDAEVGMVPFRLINLARVGLGLKRKAKTKLPKI